MASKRILVSDPLSDDGLDILKAVDDFEVLVETKLDHEELKQRLREVDAVVIRSGTKLTGDLLLGNERLRVVGRAGIGVDNVDVPAATEQGIVVMNTPGGNAVTTAEHTIALMFAAARRIPQAYAKLRDGEWDRKSFVGTELTGKTLGLVGAGNIGSLVAERALGLKMRVIAHDPYLSEDRAAQLGIELAGFDQVVAQADVLSVHVPLNDKTRGLIGKAQFEAMKPDAILVNCARGGVVDEPALAAALDAGEIATAALDVFETEPPAADNPLLQHPKVVYTPHLGASTKEAQVKVAVAVAEQVRDFLLSGEIRNAVNTPSVSEELLARLGPYLTLGEKLGSLVAQLNEGSVQRISVGFHGEIAGRDTSPVVARVVKGILDFAIEVPVNAVNAVQVAENRGIEVAVTTSAHAEDFTSSMQVRLEGGDEPVQATGAVFGKRDPRIVRINNYLVEALQTGGSLILVTNRDVPGVIGKLGSKLGEAGINIGQMYVGRSGQDDGLALTVVLLDEPAGEDLLAGLEGLDEIVTVRQVTL